MLHTETHRAAFAADQISHTDPPTRIVVRFCERLRHLPLGVWADVSQRLEVSEASADAARHRLRHTVDQLPGAMARVSPRVYELVSVAEGFMAPAMASRMKKTALSAALALLARKHLSAEDFRALYEPFAAAIPLTELESDMELYADGNGTGTPLT